MQYYYAIFKKTEEGIEIEFPDLPGCVTFGNNLNEASTNAIDVLAGWLVHAENKFIREPSSYQQLKQGDLLPIPVDEKIIQSYQELKRSTNQLEVTICDLKLYLYGID